MTAGIVTDGDSATGAASRDPVTGEVWREIPPATPAELADAVAAARAAQPAWAALRGDQRARALDRVRQALFRHRRDLARCIRRETGKPEAEAMVADVIPTLDILAFQARVAPRTLAPRRLTPRNPAVWRKRVVIRHEPYGVVGVISPWNYPLMLPVSTVGAALVTGNAVILKPSEHTPTTAEMLSDAIAEGGIPPGIFALVHGGPAVGAALCSADVDKIFFTGSARTGQLVATACAQRLVPCSLELGGSDAAIVLADADLALAAKGIVWARYANAGQTCAAPKRVFVEEAVANRFLEHLRDEIARIRVGDTSNPDVHMGPLINARQRATLSRQRDDALHRGARSITGNTDGGASHADAPMAFVDPHAESLVLQEETFGPLLAVVRVPDAAAALASANATSFGLSGSIWSRDLTRARSLARSLAAGTVMINDVLSVVGVAEVPHGGVKQSGYGRAHGVEGLLECVQTRTVVEDRLPGLPQPWWFRYSAQFARDVDDFSRLVHGGSWRERVGGLAGSLRLALRMRRMQ